MSKTYWLFADGGAEMRKDKTFFGSYGYAVFEEHDNSFVLILEGGGFDPNTTVPRMEFTGTTEGVKIIEHLLEDEEERCEIFIVLDALNTVESINSWYMNWMKNASADGTWMTKDFKTKVPKPVLNQDLLKILIAKINAIKLKHYVKVMHINSHITKKGFRACHEYFIKKNSLAVTQDGFKLLVSCNELVDNIVITQRRENKNE